MRSLILEGPNPQWLSLHKKKKKNCILSAAQFAEHHGASMFVGRELHHVLLKSTRDIGS